MVGGAVVMGFATEVVELLVGVMAFSLLVAIVRFEGVEVVLIMIFMVL